jgi:FkbM family methyltransferase
MSSVSTDENKKLFKKELIGYEQDSQNNFKNKQMLVINCFKRPLRMVNLAYMMLKNRIFQKTYKTSVQTFWKESMNIIIPEEVSQKIAAYGYFETGLTKFFLDYLHEGNILIDVGAHYGYFSLLGALIVGKDGQVHSFEPTPSTFEVLRSNTTGKDTITINNCAIFSDNREVLMNDYGYQRSAYNTIVHTQNEHDTKCVRVKALSLDSYVMEKRIIPDFLKIDAEGAEYDVLLGAHHTIRNYRPIITLEVSNESSQKCIHYLLGEGYEAYEIKKGRMIPHIVENTYTYNNILFLPQNRPILVMG